MVERGPTEPTFHAADALWPIGFKSEYRDAATGGAQLPSSVCILCVRCMAVTLPNKGRDVSG